MAVIFEEVKVHSGVRKLKEGKPVFLITLTSRDGSQDLQCFTLVGAVMWLCSNDVEIVFDDKPTAEAFRSLLVGANKENFDRYVAQKRIIVPGS